jgi:hypothetical protein
MCGTGGEYGKHGAEAICASIYKITPKSRSSTTDARSCRRLAYRAIMAGRIYGQLLLRAAECNSSRDATERSNFVALACKCRVVSISDIRRTFQARNGSMIYGVSSGGQLRAATMSRSDYMHAAILILRSSSHPFNAIGNGRPPTGRSLLRKARAQPARILILTVCFKVAL